MLRDIFSNVSIWITENPESAVVWFVVVPIVSLLFWKATYAKYNASWMSRGKSDIIPIIK